MITDMLYMYIAHYRSPSHIYIFVAVKVCEFLLQFAIDLVKFLEKLDKRYEEKVKKEGLLVARKTRKLGSASNSSPPTNAPEWTVNPEWEGE